MAISCIEYKMRLMLGNENQNGRLRCRRREKSSSGNKKNCIFQFSRNIFAVIYIYALVPTIA